MLIQNQTGLGRATPVMPEGGKIFLSQGNRCVVVVEQKPQIRSTIFSGDFVARYGGLGVRNESGSESFRLAFPYLIFVFCFEDGEFRHVQIFYRNEPLSSVENDLFMVNFPNVNSCGKVCLGDVGRLSAGLHEQAETVVAHFWNSQFGDDWRERFIDMAKREQCLSSLKAWEYASLKDPSFVLSVGWYAAGKLRKYIEDFLKESRQLDVLGEFDHLAKTAIGEAGKDMGGAVAQRVGSIDFSSQCDAIAEKAITGLVEKIACGLVECIAKNGEEVFSGGDSGCDELAVAFGGAITHCFRHPLMAV